MNLDHLLIIHFIATLLMTGVIWTIQIVHYPTFLFINYKHFKNFETFHSQRISFIVVPLMIIELITATLLTINFTTFEKTLLLTNLSLLVLTWIITFLVSARCHKKLMNGFHKPTIIKLILTNWLRTALWTARTAIVIVLLLNIIKDSH